MTEFLDFFLHLDQHLNDFITHYGLMTYVLLFLIIFAETGLVIFPLLPGDSLLFAAGALCATTPLDLSVLIPLLIIAALLGDNTNYVVGQFLSDYIKKKERIFMLKKSHIAQTEAFYSKHGGKTIILARFIPIVRTVAPFVAGAGSMVYRNYLKYCIIGAVLWVAGISSIGYLFGNLPFVKAHFEWVIFGIIGFSLLPIVYQALKNKFKKA